MTGIAAEQPSGPHGRHDHFPVHASSPASSLQPKIRIRWWNRIPLRWQIFAAFVFATSVAGIVATIVTIYDARRSAQLEIMSSMRLAERFVLETMARTPQEANGAAVLEALAKELGELRHVRVITTTLGGGRFSVLPMADAAHLNDTRQVPAWFSKLVQVEDIRRELRIGMGSRQIGSVILLGYAGDELAEVWEESKNLAGIALAFNIAVAAILYFALGRVLQPLTSLAKGLQELERGQFQHRLVRPGVPELADIAGRFNALAERLAGAKADNERLTRRLITVQDDERRHIANELHDEIGPCLFGLKANIASLEQLVDQRAHPSADRMRDRIAALGDISDQIQMLNRRLLSRIRPMALGHVPLAELVSGLVADFERVDAHPRISLSVGSVAPSYGDSIDLTVYRCIQEGITNAKRHSEAQAINVRLAEQLVNRSGPDDAEQGAFALKITVEDDGSGFPPGKPWGFGLTGMDERVRALGGTLRIVERAEGGTRLEVAIPLDDNRRQVAFADHSETGSRQQ